jgi:hypothetical protein
VDARQFLEAAELLHAPDVFTTNVIHAAIAASDAITCYALAERSNGGNHASAVDLLRQIDASLGTTRKRALDRKTQAAFESTDISSADAASYANGPSGCCSEQSPDSSLEVLLHRRLKMRTSLAVLSSFRCTEAWTQRTARRSTPTALMYRSTSPPPHPPWARSSPSGSTRWCRLMPRHASSRSAAPTPFLHLTRHQFAVSLRRLQSALVPEGRLAFTVKQGDGEGWSTAKLGAPRYFCYWQSKSLRHLVAAAGFTSIQLTQWTTPSGQLFLAVIAESLPATLHSAALSTSIRR